jgi:hypothetical protein
MIARRLAPILTLTYFTSCGPTAGDPTPDSTSTAADASTTASASDPTSTAPDPTAADPTTTTTTDTSTGELSTTSHGDFIILPDGGVCGAAFAPDGELRCSRCDVFDQDCPRDTKCAPWDSSGNGEWTGTKCTPVGGPGVAGDLCTVEGNPMSGVDDCALGFLCFDVDAENHGTCVPLCTGTEDMPQCPGGLACMAIDEGVLYLCMPGCEPLVQDCPEGELCLPIDETFLCAPDASGDAGAVNDPCGAADACDEGLICLASDAASSACDPQFTGCCQPYCQLPDGPCPNPDQVCKPVYETNPPGHEDVGHCAIP